MHIKSEEFDSIFNEILEEYGVHANEWNSLKETTDSWLFEVAGELSDEQIAGLVKLRNNGCLLRLALDGWDVSEGFLPGNFEKHKDE